MFLLEVQTALTKSLLRARKLDKKFNKGDYFPEFSILVDELPTSIAKWEKFLTEKTLGHITFRGDYGIKVDEVPLGEWVEVVDFFEDKSKFRVTPVSDLDLFFILNVSVGEITSFNQSLQHTQSNVFAEGRLPEMGVFSKETVNLLVKASRQWFAVPVNWEGNDPQIPFGYLFNFGNPVYRFTVVVNGVTVTVNGAEFHEMFDELVGELKKVKGVNLSKAKLIVEDLEQSFRGQLGHIPFTSILSKGVYEGIDVRFSTDWFKLIDFVNGLKGIEKN